ncbi:hypothetical protein CTI12_AA091230 [Artemisia annua]|uniref:Uncharacterized protein n=1 Tax=Artemisia annua TaxID=35608 RepID=A0A2U1NFE3_ARTAN|nr:hypothetical protein CTI12_AA091230 [Artemisia annua]
MPPKFPRCLEISNQIGDRRVEKVLEAIFSREKNAYLCDEREYNQRIEELKVRIEHRHEIYKELKKHGIDPVFDECLVELKAAEKADFEEMGWRVEKVLEAIFSREKNAYLCDEREYNQRIEELKVRIEHRHEIYKELKKHGIDPVFDECLVELKAAEKADFEEMGWLIRRSYAASLRAAEKGRIEKKLRRF